MSGATVAVSLALGLGCQGEPGAQASSSASALRQRFPQQAALVLEKGEPLVPTGEGFARKTPSAPGAFRGLEITLPREGRDALRFRTRSGVELRVRELGAAGEGALTGQAIAYPRAGGTSFWMATSGGVEEWLHLDASAVHAGEPVATWELENASARQHGASVDVVDASGVVRFSVTAPAAYAADGRTVEARLVARGARIDLEVDDDDEALLIDPVWVPVASMAEARNAATATLLGNGKVLLVGGSSAVQVYLATAELYDPSNDTWSPAGTMSAERVEHTATLLGNGKVLVAGGDNSMDELASAELYDPVANSWSSAGSMAHTHWGHTATVLPDGKVLVTGGYLESASELYDPVTNTWMVDQSMTFARFYFTATLLPTGKVLAVGNSQDGYPIPNELYDPLAHSWKVVASSIEPRSRHTATLLANGKLLIAGGNNINDSPMAAELYEASNDTWGSAGTLLTSRSLHAAVLLADGSALVIGGTLDQSVERYDPALNTWSAVSPLLTQRTYATATVLGDGAVLVAGGGNALGSLASAELYTSTKVPLGAACSLGTNCQSGYCADGVCCDTACGDGDCDACSIAVGAAVDGTCALLTGAACDDGDACTSGDSCQAGACVGKSPVLCPALDSCHLPGQCEPKTGSCTDVAKPDTAACDDGDACTQLDTCVGGVCKGVKPVACEATDECHSAGTCDSATGLCSAPAKSEGAPCAGGTCHDGACAPTLEGTSSGDSGAPDRNDGCGCGVVGAPVLHPGWLGLGLLLLRRRRSRGRRITRPG